VTAQVRSLEHVGTGGSASTSRRHPHVFLTSPDFWIALSQIILINIVLSGDNAVVIALASRSLPPAQQKKAIIFGSVGAIVLRVILTFFAVYLLTLPYLKLIGAALLLWIGIGLLKGDDGEDPTSRATPAWLPPSRPSSSPTW
jgi:predicted tellurium resistance membrane protein TerC